MKVKSWKTNFHNWKGIWIYKISLNRFLFEKKNTKEKDSYGENDDEKGGKFWVDGEVLNLIALRGEMELEFAKNAKKKGNFCCHRSFVFIFCQFWSPSYACPHNLILGLKFAIIFFFSNGQIQFGPIESTF